MKDVERKWLLQEIQAKSKDEEWFRELELKKVLRGTHFSFFLFLHLFFLPASFCPFP